LRPPIASACCRNFWFAYPGQQASPK